MCTISMRICILYCLIGVLVIWKEHWTKMHQNKWKKKNSTSNRMTLICITFDAWMKKEEKEMWREKRNTNDPLCLSFCHIQSLRFTFSLLFIVELLFDERIRSFASEIPSVSFWPLILLSIECISSKFFSSTWKHTNNTPNKVECSNAMHSNQRSHTRTHTHREEVINERIKHIDINLTLSICTIEKCISNWKLNHKNQMPYFLLLFFSFLLLCSVLLINSSIAIFILLFSSFPFLFGHPLISIFILHVCVRFIVHC